MDVLTHTLSGVAIGTVVSSFSNRGLKDRLKIVTVAGFAGALPDLDAVSLWSGFDSTIGDLFNLPYTGKEIYSAKLRYSHHAFLHSAFASILISGIIALIAYVFDYRLKHISLSDSIKKNKLILISFILGFLIHLIGDMPTPSSTWGGVGFFWPFKYYIGGSGEIWWWNNYDIFLIVIGVIFINLIFIMLNKYVALDLRKFTIVVFLIGLTIVIVQIKTRDNDYAYSGHTVKYQEFEDKSKHEQKEILGDQLYQLMEKIDNRLKINF